MSKFDILFLQRHANESKPCHYCNPAEGAIHRRVDGLRCLYEEADRAPVRCLSCSHSRKLYNSVARLSSLCQQFHMSLKELRNTEVWLQKCRPEPDEERDRANRLLG